MTKSRIPIAFSRRRVIKGALAAGVAAPALLNARSALAAYPDRTVRIVVGEKRQQYREAYNYLRKRIRFLDYGQYRRDHLPIGSGVTEAGCKELIKARFCRSGMRWKRTSGAPLLQLRAIKLSQQWESFWAKVLRYAA